MRTKYGVAAKQASRTGASTSEKEDALIKFGGAVIFGMAQAVLKDCPVSNELAVVEPVNLLQADSALPGSGDAGAVGASAGVGGAGGEDVLIGESGDSGAGGAVQVGGTAAVGASSRSIPPHAPRQDLELAEASSDKGHEEEDGGGESPWSDDDEETPGLSTPASAQQTLINDKTATKIEMNSKIKKPKMCKKSKKDTAAGVLHEYLQAKMADGSSGAGGGSVEGGNVDIPTSKEASVGEVRLAVMNLLNAFAEKAHAE